jgi:hypothetical protein
MSRTWRNRGAFFGLLGELTPEGELIQTPQAGELYGVNKAPCSCERRPGAGRHRVPGSTACGDELDLIDPFQCLTEQE